MMPSSQAPPDLVEALAGFVARYPRLFVLTGAGCSTDSGLPDYRDADGRWKPDPPITYQEFVRAEAARRRYWARSLLGWPRFARARPGAAHLALAQLEASGHVHQLVTQNVDGLHQRAGSQRVIDLHGRLDTVECLGCRHRVARDEIQAALAATNPGVNAHAGTPAPDGDARLAPEATAAFEIPACPVCGGVLKPAVVFFGESVPRERVELALGCLAEADALLVIGSSLMVYSGYRFCVAARAAAKPIAAINLGRTRADPELALKLAASCGEILPRLLAALGVEPASTPGRL